jgi:hypothetical protein
MNTKLTRAIGLALCLIVELPVTAAAQALPAGVCTTINQVRGTAPITSADQFGAMMNRIAWAHRDQGIGLSRKNAGSNCPSPAGPIACDILQRKSDNAMWDIFGSAGPNEPTTPNCGDSIGPSTDLSRPWTAAVDPGDTPPPAPPTTPPPTVDASTTALLQEQIDELKALRAALAITNAKLDTQAALTVDTNAKLEQLRLDIIKATKDLVRSC